MYRLDLIDIKQGVIMGCLNHPTIMRIISDDDLSDGLKNTIIRMAAKMSYDDLVEAGVLRHHH